MGPRAAPHHKSRGGARAGAQCPPAVARRRDPLDARKEQRTAQALEAARTITFEKAAQAYFAADERGWWNVRHRAQFLSTLKTYAYPKIGNLPVAAVDVGLVLKVIEPIRQYKTETASRIQGRIEAVLDWATVRGYRSGDNPALWKGYIENVLPSRGKIQKTKHHAALPFTDLPEFMTALGQRDGVAKNMDGASRAHESQ